MPQLFPASLQVFPQAGEVWRAMPQLFSQSLEAARMKEPKGLACAMILSLLPPSDVPD